MTELGLFVEQWVFYIFSAVAIASGVMMVAARNPVRSALFLVLVFASCAVLWMLLEAEFLALLLIFVYVGAVMTLFLFVVMMLNLEPEKLRDGFVRFLPWGILVLALMVGLMLLVLAPNHFESLAPVHHSAHHSNTLAIGEVLYTEYAYPLELAGVLLLVAMIAAVSLSHRGPQKRKEQNIKSQLQRDPKAQVRLVSMSADTTWNKE